MSSTAAILIGLLAVLCLVEAVFIIERRPHPDNKKKDVDK